jgi:superfamily II DNA or RNA helicase
MLSRFGFIVNKQKITDEESKTIKSDLTVSPLTFGGIKPTYFKIYKESPNQLRLPAFYGIEKFGKPSTDKTPHGVSVNIDFVGSLKSETSQNEAANAGIKALKDKGGGVLVLPPGFGKTTVALYICSKMKLKTLIVIHKEFLLNQWVDRIKQFIPTANIGFIRQNKVEVAGKDIVVAMLQSLCMKDYSPEVFQTFGLVIVDETHHICSRVFSRAFSNIRIRYSLGLSATPERKDGLSKVLYWFLGNVFYEAKREANKNVEVQIIKFSCSEYDEIHGKTILPNIINGIVEVSERNDIIKQVVTELAALGRKIIILSDRRQHCEMLCGFFLDNTKYTSGLYMGGIKQDVLNKNEHCQLLFGTYSLAHEGLDIPSLNTIVLATPKSDVIQACGRIMRETGQVKKFEPLIIDINDNIKCLVGQGVKRRKFYKASGFSIKYKKDETKHKQCLFLNDN